MDGPAVLARYDAEIRADPPPETGVIRTWAEGVLRTEGAYDLIGWWDFPAEATAAVVAREAAHFAGREVEWKLFSHDRPAGLAAALTAAGFVPDALETFLVLDLETHAPPFNPPAGIEVRQVTDAAGVADQVEVGDAAFGRAEPWRVAALTARLQDAAQALFVAYDGDTPVSSGRLELPAERAFAGLFSGGTIPGYQRRGIYRALVAARAAEARRRGHRYLTVDARETSRPILGRLGFEALATVRGWVLNGAG